MLILKMNSASTGIAWNTLRCTSKQSTNEASNFQISQTSAYFPPVSIWI